MTPEISVVCWKWRPKQPSGPRFFASEHVNVLQAMVKRNLPIPHRFICVTDDPSELAPGIEAFPMPSETFDALVNPHQQRYNLLRAWGSKKYFPSCYRRLWMFSDEARVLGERILAIDIDVVVTGSLLPLVNRTEDFVGWCDENAGRPKIAGGVFLLKTGTCADVWTEFDPVRSPKLAAERGYTGSDQAWMTYKLFPPPARWGRRDGLFKISWLGRERPRHGVRLVFTSGRAPPWNPEVIRRYPWVKRYWKL